MVKYNIHYSGSFSSTNWGAFTGGDRCNREMSSVAHNVYIIKLHSPLCCIRSTAWPTHHGGWAWGSGGSTNSKLIIKVRTQAPISWMAWYCTLSPYPPPPPPLGDYNAERDSCWQSSLSSENKNVFLKFRQISIKPSKVLGKLPKPFATLVKTKPAVVDRCETQRMGSLVCHSQYPVVSQWPGG